MDFYNGKDLLKKCQEMNAPISDIMKLRETAMGGCAGTPTGCSLGCGICK